MALVETSTISASHGRLFLQTNCGAIACCDQEEGDVLWLTAYPEVTNNTRYFGWGYPRNSYASIFPSAPGLDGAVVVAAPTNGNNAFAIDALSGRTIRALRGRGRIAYAAYKFFLGVQGGIAYFQSDNAIIAEAVSLRAQALDEADKLVSRRRLTTNEEFSAEVKGDLNQRRGIIVGDEIWLDLGEKRGLMVLNRFTLAKKHLVAWPADSVSKVLKESKVGGEDVVKNQPMIDRYGRPVNRAMLNHGIVTMRFIRSSASPLERPLVVRSNNTGAKIYVIEDSASEPNKE